MVTNISFQLLNPLLYLGLLIKVDFNELVESYRALTVYIDFLENLFGECGIYCSLSFLV